LWRRRRRMCWSWDSSLKLNFTLTELNSNSIEDTWDANWCKKIQNLFIVFIICDYGVDKRKKLKKQKNWKTTFPFP
jgi:hypothetical protein